MALDESLKNLNLSYLDLYLIHWPGAGGIPTNSSQNRVLREKSWKKLVEAKNKGKVKSIGVSNYVVRHLDEMLHYTDVKPDVNQVSWFFFSSFG